MAANLFSQTWYLVADLKVRLRRHAVIHRHLYRGSLWYVLQDFVTGQFHRFSPEAYQIIGMMDGEKSLQEIWVLACEKLGDDMPSQDEIINLVSKLFRANVLQSDASPDIDNLHNRHKTIARKKLLQTLKSPLSIRLPLCDPDRFLFATVQWVKPIFSLLGLLVWFGVVVYALILAGIHFDALTSNMSDKVLSVENILLTMLVYPVVKLIHEMGHAYAVKRWGGEVHEMGVMFLVFFPVPYVDASAASAFRNKYQRMIVGASGIMVEAAIASLAMILWVSMEPGTARAIAYNTMLIAGVSTILFNGNPLLRFDAYYVLADFLEIPNLAMRGNQQLGYLIKRYAFGVRDIDSHAASKRESIWLVSYAITSYIYRMIVMMAISLFVAAKYFIIGVLLALWSFYLSVLGPFVRVMIKPFRDPSLVLRRKRVTAVFVSVSSMFLLLLAVIPFPYATYAEGVLSAPENTYVRTEVSGFIDSITSASGDKVKKGAPLLLMRASDIESEVAVLEAQVKEAEYRYKAALSDRVDAALAREVVSYTRQKLSRELLKQASLKIVSPRQGIFVLPNNEDLLGRYIERGEVLGYVIDVNDLPVTTMVAEDSIDLVRNRTQSVELRLVSDESALFTGSVARIVPASTRELPSEVLSTQGGGLIGLDPAEPESLKAIGRYFKIEVSAPKVPKQRLNERVYVLFKHDAEPLIYRWYRGLRRVFLRQLNV